MKRDLFFALALLVGGAGCPGNGNTTGSGGTTSTTTGSTTATTTSGSTTASASTTGTGSTGSTTSTTTGGACIDATEPNDTISSPGFFNDAGTGVQLCDHTGVNLSGALADMSDVDALRGYSDMSGTSSCTPAPIATITLAAPAKACFYLQDDNNPVVTSCDTGFTLSSDPGGYTGCCGSLMAGMHSIKIPGVANLFQTSANTQFAVVLSNSTSAACNSWTVNVHF